MAGKFVAGKSGNPAGRPPGIPNPPNPLAVLKPRALGMIAAKYPAILQKALDMAVDGDRAMLTFFLNLGLDARGVGAGGKAPAQARPPIQLIITTAQAPEIRTIEASEHGE